MSNLEDKLISGLIHVSKESQSNETLRDVLTKNVDDLTKEILELREASDRICTSLTAHKSFLGELLNYYDPKIKEEVPDLVNKEDAYMSKKETLEAMVYYRECSYKSSHKIAALHTKIQRFIADV